MGARILVIEDNLANLKLMAFLLRTFGHEVSTAIGGEEGLALAAAERPALILCDLQMPVVDGFEVLRRLDATPGGRPAPVVAITALAMMGDREKILAAGFDGYLPKPIDPTTFRQQVEELLASGGERAAAQPLLALRGETPMRPERAPERPRATVLAVDDAPWNLQLLRSTLQPRGYRVLTAGSAAEALALAREQRPDVILSDLHMPGVSGLELLRALRSDRELAAIPFAFVTYSGGEADIALAREEAPVLQRAGQPDELTRQIEGLLTGAGA